MPDMQPQAPAPGALPPATVQAIAPWSDDGDYALGCECANPALQIERWGEDACIAAEPH